MSQSAIKSAGNLFGHRMLTSFRSKAYRIFFIGSFGQIAAMNIQMMVNPLLIYRLTESPALLGVSSLVGALPTIVIGLFGGELADRLPKKRILVACFGLMTLLYLFIALMLDTNRLSKEVAGSWLMLMAANFLQGCVMGFLMPALMAILPETVQRENLMNAVALNNLQMSVISMVVPSLAGIMIDHLGFESVYYAIAAMFIFAALLFLFIPAKQNTIAQRGQILSNISQGFKYIRSHAAILYLLLTIMTMVLLSMSYQSLLPLFTDGIFKVGATGLGLLMSLSGAGGLVGSLAIAILPNRRRGAILLFSGVISGLSLLIFAFSPIWGICLGMMLIIGFAGALRGTLSNTLLQTYSDPVYMGRVMSLTHVQFGIMSVLTFGAGVLAEKVPVQWVVGGMAGLLTLIITAVIARNRTLRSLD